MSPVLPLEDIALEILLPSTATIGSVANSVNEIELFIEQPPVLTGNVPAIQEITVEVPGPAYIINNGEGSSGQQLFQATAAATWTFNITGFTRPPAVTLYDATGKEFESDVYATSSQVVVTHSVPVAGSVVLT